MAPSDRLAIAYALATASGVEQPGRLQITDRDAEPELRKFVYFNRSSR